MKNDSSVCPTRLWHWAVALLLLATLSVSANPASADSVQSRPKRIPAKSTFERVVSFPGQLAYAPVRYAVLGLGYAGVHMVEKGVVRKIVTVVGGAGFTPVYAPRTGAGLRYTKLDCIAPGARFVTTASSWVDGRQLFSVVWYGMPVGASVTSDIAVRYRSLTSEAFYGVGPESTPASKVFYSEEDALLELSFHKNLNRFFQTSLSLGVSNTSIFDGRNGILPTITDLYSDSTLPGFKDKNRFQGTEFSLRYNCTNDAGHPTAGRIGEVAAEFYTDIHDDNLSFWNCHVNLIQHIHLFNDRTLVIRGAAEMTEALIGSTIPFYHLAEIGSYGTVRGFTRGRFRGNDYAIGSAEYRYPIWIPWAKIVDAVLFVDAGQVAQDILADASIEEMQFGYGGGFRFYNAANLIAKTEIAFSDESFRFYFTLNTP